MSTPLETARRARDEGMASAEARIGAEQDRKVIDNVIAYLADTMDEFSVNEARDLLPVVAPQLIGSRFLAAANRGQIERTGDTQAAHEAGHARRVSTWRKATGQQVAKQPESKLLTAHGSVPSVRPEHERAIRDAHFALEARGRGKSGVHTTTDACKVIRSLLDVLGDLTGITGSTDELF